MTETSILHVEQHGDCPHVLRAWVVLSLAMTVSVELVCQYARLPCLHGQKSAVADPEKASSLLLAAGKQAAHGVHHTALKAVTL
jgi:hypothetical protein